MTLLVYHLIKLYYLEYKNTDFLDYSRFIHLCYNIISSDILDTT